MSEKQESSKHAQMPDQEILAERETRRAEMIRRNMDYGDIRGITAMIVWLIVVVLLFAAMYFLSGD